MINREGKALKGECDIILKRIIVFRFTQVSWLKLHTVGLDTKF